MFWYIDSTDKTEEEILKVLHDNTNASFKIILTTTDDAIGDDFLEQCFAKIENYWNSIKELKNFGLNKY